jgi:hypothetical protein
MKDEVLSQGNPRLSYQRIDLREANEILYRLSRLAGHDTDFNNPNGEILKDEKAREAIVLAGKLIGPLIQWAINHEAGQIRRRIGPSVPLRPHRLENPQKYGGRTRERNLAANSHTNERLGAAYRIANPKLDRRIVAAVLGLISSGMNFRPGRALSGALEALEQGEVSAMLEPRTTGRASGAFTTDRLKLGALAHVYFRWGTGRRKGQAIDEVAEALGTSDYTIKQWEKRLPDTVDRDYIDEHLKHARAVGKLASAIKGRRAGGRDKFEPLFGLNLAHLTDLEAAKRAVASFSPAQLDKLAQSLRGRIKTNPI